MAERLRLGAALLWTAVILILCWTPGTYLPAAEGHGTFVEIAHLDKVVHAGMFVVFSVLWLRTTSGRLRDYLLVLAAGSFLAVLTELVQTWEIINRDGELVDGITDVLGVLAGFPIYRSLQPRYERWRLSRGRVKSGADDAVRELA
ncbi:VanZ family protein [Aquisphaera insulae]|uniref:VanZ family protein n=1 Tax=Aquisphaera insulae TaxID=2712864 RepID=UPI0013EB74C7|nr:VanZ family protein [Aquisphaera insulae]